MHLQIYLINRSFACLMWLSSQHIAVRLQDIFRLFWSLLSKLEGWYDAIILTGMQIYEIVLTQIMTGRGSTP